SCPIPRKLPEYCNCMCEKWRKDDRDGEETLVYEGTRLSRGDREMPIGRRWNRQRTGRRIHYRLHASDQPLSRLWSHSTDPKSQFACTFLHRRLCDRKRPEWDPERVWRQNRRESTHFCRATRMIHGQFHPI
ncbi:hypothetical protein PENTCL1PPCAC_2687, partial [Pristionchus entomophagus]